jgi:hypothetical protein
MANMNEPHDPRQPGSANSPGDIPARRPAALSRLDALLGDWEMEAVFAAGYFSPGSPPSLAAAAIPRSSGSTGSSS